MSIEATTNVVNPGSVETPKAPITETAGVQPPQAPPAEAPKAPEQDLSKQFAYIAKQEKRLREDRAQLAEQAKKYEKLDKILANPKEDPLAILEAAGLTVDDLIQHSLKKGQKPTAEERVLTVEEKLAKFEKDRDDERERTRQDGLNKEIQSFKDHIKASVATDAEKYPTIAADEAYDEVFDACRQLIMESPEKYQTRAQVDAVLPKVLELAESELFEKAKKKYSGLKKFKSLFETVPPVDPASAPDIERAKDTQAPPTLTNKQAPTTPVGGKGPLLSQEESLRRAAALLKWD